jgi:hypothetical protein
LSPQALLALAASHGVDVLAITDHDTVNAYKQLVVDPDSTVTLIPGIELSTSWLVRSIHIVGLNIDPENSELLGGITRQQQARDERAQTIAGKLTRLGIENPYAAVKALAGDAGIGRPHFAKYLVDIGKVRDVQTAFRKYLGTGKIGDVTQGWASMTEVIDWITAAGGIPVLAHPAKYKFTMTKLRALLADFRDSGGLGVEVVCGRQEPDLTKRLAAIAIDLDLLASTGSDFHHPDHKWSRPGGFPALPDNVTPVWDRW